MTRTFLKWLYLRNPKLFQEFLVEDLIGQIPKDIKEPAIGFLGRGRDVLTRYLLFQAYIIQRRGVAEIGKADSYHGMLVFIKFMLGLLIDAQPRETLDIALEEEVKREDPLEKVKVFSEGMERFIKSKK